MFNAQTKCQKHCLRLAFTIVFVVAAVGTAAAQSANNYQSSPVTATIGGVSAGAPNSPQANEGDFENAKFEIYGSWYLVKPSGNFTFDGGTVDVDRDFGISSSSEFVGKITYRLGRKHHLTFDITPYSANGQRVLTRTIIFRDQTYTVGTAIQSEMKVLYFFPRYRYDFINKKQFHLGGFGGVDIIHIKPTITGAVAIVTPGGTTSSTVTRTQSATEFLPVFGPEFRWYPMKGSDRFNLNGEFGAMYFGFGHYFSAQMNVGFSLTHHVGMQAGYVFTSDTFVKPTDSRIGLNLKYQGPQVGLTARW